MLWFLVIEHPRTDYREDFLESIERWENRHITCIQKRLAQTLKETVGMTFENPAAVLQFLSEKDWSIIRENIAAEFQQHNIQAPSAKKLLLYLNAESWDAFWSAFLGSLHRELDLEECIAETYVEEVKALIYERIFQLLSGTQKRAFTDRFLQTHTRAQEERGSLERKITDTKIQAMTARKAVEQWCKDD